MTLGRRDFLRLLGLGAGVATLGCARGRWSVPDHLVELALRGPGLESFVHTACGLCSGACGVTVRLVDDLPVGITGNPRHPLSRGGLCPVGKAALDVLYAPERLQGPLRRDADGTLRRGEWAKALDEITKRIRRLDSGQRRQRIAFLVGEGGVLQRELIAQFAAALGCENLAQPTDRTALGTFLTQGIAEPPAFDLAHADVVLSFGLDVFEDGDAPVYATAALVGSRPTDERAALVHVGTRLSPSAAKARPHVPVLPGTHGAFALGVAHVLVREGRFDHAFVAERAFGFEDWTDEKGRRRLGFRRLLLERYYPDRVAKLCGCATAQIAAVARRFGNAAAPVAVAGGEAVSDSNATVTVMAVHALNALVGAVDRPGGVVLRPPIPFTPLESVEASPTGASGSIFAASSDGAPFGVDPVEALAERVLDGSHPLEVLFIVGANPVFDSPAGERLAAALERIPLVVAFAPFRDETAARASIVLPTGTFLENWHDVSAPGSVPFSVITVGSPVIKPLYDTRSAGEVVLELARGIGGPVAAALPWASYPDYLKHRQEGLVLSGQGAVISGSFEETWVQFLEDRGWRFLGHTDVDEFWKDLVREGGWWNPVRVQGDWTRLFRTSSGRFEFFSRALERRLIEIGRAARLGTLDDEAALALGASAAGLAAQGDEACLPHFEPPLFSGEGGAVMVPFRPATSRGDLGAVSPMVLEMFGYPVLSGWQTWVELAPETARELSVADGDTVAVEGNGGRLEVIVRVEAGAVPGVVHVPLGLGHTELPGARGVGANPVKVLGRTTDALSGTRSLASTRVHLRLLHRRRHGAPAPGGEGKA